MTIKNFKHIKIVTLLAVLFLFSAPPLIHVPLIPKIFSPSEKIHADAHGS